MNKKLEFRTFYFHHFSRLFDFVLYYNVYQFTDFGFVIIMSSTQEADACYLACAMFPVCYKLDSCPRRRAHLRFCHAL